MQRARADGAVCVRLDLIIPAAAVGMPQLFWVRQVTSSDALRDHALAAVSCMGPCSLPIRTAHLPAQGLGADVVLHFGMHGTMEWLPGAPLGNTGLSWSDMLLGWVGRGGCGGLQIVQGFLSPTEDGIACI